MKTVPLTLYCILVWMIAVDAYAGEPPSDPATYRTTNEWRLDRDEQKTAEDIAKLCERDADCIDDQFTAHDRMKEIWADAHPYCFGRVTWYCSSPRPPNAIMGRAMLVRDLWAAALVETQDKRDRNNYVAAEQWLNTALDARDISRRAGCLLHDEINRCWDDYSLRMIED